MIGPLKVGQKYVTRSGQIVEIIELTTWSQRPEGGATGAALLSANRYVYKDGEYIGRGDFRRDCPQDLIRLHFSSSEPEQLDLF